MNHVSGIKVKNHMSISIDSQNPTWSHHKISQRKYEWKENNKTTHDKHITNIILRVGNFK